MNQKVSLSLVQRTLDALCSGISALLKLMLIAMLGVMVSLVITRYFFSYSPGWSEEAVRFMLVWSVLLGAAVLVLFEDHIALHLFVEQLTPRWKLAQRMLCHLTVAVPSALIAWKGVEFATQMVSVTAPGTQWPMTVPTLAIPVSALLMLLFASILALRDLLSLSSNAEPMLPGQATHMDTSFKPAGPSDAARLKQD